MTNLSNRDLIRITEKHQDINKDNLSAGALGVYYKLYRHFYSTSFSFSMEKMLEITKMSRRVLSECIRELQAKKIIRTHRPYKKYYVPKKLRLRKEGDND
jgi:hypothetical protein